MATDLATYSGNFFRKYAKKTIDSWTPASVIQAKKPVGEAEKIGERFVVPIMLAEEQGATYFKTASTGAPALEAAVDGELKSLEIQGMNHVFRANIGYEAAAASLASDAASDNTTGRVALSLRNNARRRIENDMLYGQYGLGVVEVVNPAGASANTIQIKESEFAARAFVGMKGSKWEIFDPTLATQRTANGVIYTVTKVNISKRWVTFDTALTGGSAVVANDVIFYKGQVEESGTPVHHSMRGLHLQLGNTGVHFGQDAATYEVVAGNVLDAAGARLDFSMAQEAMSRCQDMGAEDEEMVLICAPKVFGMLNSDLAADRRFDDSYKKEKGELGNRNIVYYSSLGDVRIVSHPLVKRGYAYIFAWDDLIRPGSYDLAFTRPVGRGQDRFGGNMLIELADNAGFQIRLYHNSALAHLIPSHGVRLENLGLT